MCAVGSYTESRGLNQGAASSTGGADGDDEPNKKYWFLNIKRYRRFFNVDTEVHLSTRRLHEHIGSNFSSSLGISSVGFPVCCAQVHSQSGLTDVTQAKSCYQMCGTSQSYMTPHKMAYSTAEFTVPGPVKFADRLMLLQDILIRIRDSVIGSYKADFFDKTTDNADL